MSGGGRKEHQAKFTTWAAQGAQRRHRRCVHRVLGCSTCESNEGYVCVLAAGIVDLASPTASPKWSVQTFFPAAWCSPPQTFCSECAVHVSDTHPVNDQAFWSPILGLVFGGDSKQTSAPPPLETRYRTLCGPQPPFGLDNPAFAHPPFVTLLHRLGAMIPGLRSSLQLVRAAVLVFSVQRFCCLLSSPPLLLFVGVMVYAHHDAEQRVGLPHAPLESPSYIHLSCTCCGTSQ